MEWTMTIDSPAVSKRLQTQHHIELHYNAFKEQLMYVVIPISPPEIVFGLDPDTYYHVEFARDTMVSFFQNNRIPFLYPLPMRVMELRPDLPECTYPEYRESPTRSHWVVGKPDRQRLCARIQNYRRSRS
jgi:hypothetical protein